MKSFPVQHGGDLKEVPWDFLAPHELQAIKNHDQTLKRLAERGGCSPMEIYAIVHGLRLFDSGLPKGETAIARVLDDLYSWVAAGGGAMFNVKVRLAGFWDSMLYKLELRKKRPPDPAKWPVDAIDRLGQRDWHKVPLERLRAKLEEEIAELFEPGADVQLEAADVALVAFMIADHPENRKKT